MDPVLTPFLIAAGVNAIGGAASMYQASRMKEPRSLGRMINRLEDPGYFTPMLQRVYNSAQGDATIQRQLSRQGLDSPMLEQELLEANRARAGEAVREGTQQMEGQRLSMLERLLGQRMQFQMAKQGMKASALNQTIAGLGSAAMAGGQAYQQNKMFNAQMAQQNNFFNQQQSMMQRFMSGMNSVPQLPMGGAQQGVSYIPQGTYDTGVKPFYG